MHSGVQRHLGAQGPYLNVDALYSCLSILIYFLYPPPPLFKVDARKMLRWPIRPSLFCMPLSFQLCVKPSVCVLPRINTHAIVYYPVRLLLRVHDVSAVSCNKQIALGVAELADVNFR